jgi:hypothetical protein
VKLKGVSPEVECSEGDSVFREEGFKGQEVNLWSNFKAKAL